MARTETMDIGFLCGSGEDAIDTIITVEYSVTGKYWAGDYYNPPEYPEYEFNFVSARVDCPKGMESSYDPLTPEQIAMCENFVESSAGYDKMCEKAEDSDWGEDDDYPDDRYDD